MQLHNVHDISVVHVILKYFFALRGIQRSRLLRLLPVRVAGSISLCVENDCEDDVIFYYKCDHVRGSRRCDFYNQWATANRLSVNAQ